MVTRIVSDQRMSLLKVIRENNPDSIDAVANAVGKHAPNDSRTLHTMAQYGFVTLTNHGRMVTPKVTADGVNVDFS